MNSAAGVLISVRNHFVQARCSGSGATVPEHRRAEISKRRHGTSPCHFHALRARICPFAERGRSPPLIIYLVRLLRQRDGDWVLPTSFLQNGTALHCLPIWLRQKKYAIAENGKTVTEERGRRGNGGGPRSLSAGPATPDPSHRGVTTTPPMGFSVHETGVKIPNVTLFQH